jgi:hypothetical protein
MTDSMTTTAEIRTPTPPTHPRLWLVAGVVTGSAVAVTVVLVLVALLSPPPPPQSTAPPRFVDESAGVLHEYEGGFAYFVGGGVAVLDCNGDELPELYLAGGTAPASLFANKSTIGGPLEFEALPSPTTDLDRVTGAYPLDFDGDGFTDLAVLRIGENVLLKGTGDCGFERANERLDFDGGDSWTVGFSATWRDGDSMPTLAFGNYLVSSDERTCADHELFVPNADSYSNPTPIEPGYCTLSMLFSDWNRSGVADLRITNDRHYYQDGQEQLMRFDGDDLVPYTPDQGWQSMQIWGMGIASQDLTGDGRPEIVLTSQGDNKLQTLVPSADGPEYTDIALERGTTAHRPFAGGDVMPSTGWHPEFDDVNNDGWTDLYLSKGNVDAMPEFAEKDPNNLLMGRDDGTFIESAEAAGILGFQRTRGAAVVDLNLDGMLDLVEVNREANVGIWRNVGWGTADAPEQMGSWLAVRLRGRGSNADAIGAWIEVRTPGRVQEQEVVVGGGHASGDRTWTHFGIGDRESAELRVSWPDGTHSEWFSVPADRLIVVDEATGQAGVMDPGRRSIG